MGNYDTFITEEDIKFGFGVRNPEADNHWQDAPENFSFLNKKTILILPGSGTNSAKAANGMCKIAEKMLPEDKKDSWQICSMYYGNSKIMHVPTVIRAQRMFDKYFVPLIATKDKNDDLQRLSADQAMKNVRNLVVLTHCYGGYIMDALEQQLKQTLQDLKYSVEEQNLIQKQLFVIQHNNIQDNLEKHPTATTQLIRISQQDDERVAEDMRYGTFSHYMQTYAMPEDNVSYLKISENQRILYANRITQKGVNEHNGGYWQNKSSKTLAGAKEEDVFQVILDEVVSSDYPIENMEQIIRNAAAKNPQAKEKIYSAMETGKSMMDGYAEYADKSNGKFNILYEKLKNNQLSKTDILATDTNCCFVQDDNDRFLMDYLLERGQFDLAQEMFRKMAKIAKIDKFGHCLDFGNDCSNKSQAAKKTTQWAQTAINKNQPELLIEMAKVDPNLWKCNYNEADIDILKIAAMNVFTKNNLPNASLDQWKFMQNLLAVYERNESLPVSDDTQTIRKYLENFLFVETEDKSKKIYDKEKIIKTCEAKGLTRLVNLAKTNWGDLIQRNSTQGRDIIR